MLSKSRNSPSDETLKYYNEFKEDLIASQASLIKAVEAGSIRNAEDLLPTCEKKNGNPKRPSNCNIIFTNQLNEFGALEVADKVCEKYKINRQKKMVISRQLGGIIWNNLPEKIKTSFNELADEVERQHRIKYPNYKLTKERRNRKNIVFKPYVQKNNNKKNSERNERKKNLVNTTEIHTITPKDKPKQGQNLHSRSGHACQINLDNASSSFLPNYYMLEFSTPKTPVNVSEETTRMENAGEICHDYPTFAEHPLSSPLCTDALPNLIKYNDEMNINSLIYNNGLFYNYLRF